MAFKLQEFFQRAETAHGVSTELRALRAGALAGNDAAFANLQAHDRQEAERLREPYNAYVTASTNVFEVAAEHHGSVPTALQHGSERQLTRFESAIDIEIRRVAHGTRVTNPQARLVLIVAAIAALILVAALVWEFDMQRRAGQIDRDNASRSEELMRLRDDFVAAVSHELRTPLTSILGYLELIAEDDTAADRPDQEAYLAVVKRNADRLLRLVSDLLLVSEVENRTLTLELHEVDLAGLATECVEAAKPAADARQIRLTLSNDNPGPLEGDPIRLAQMMDNLLSNAIKFTPTGGRIHVGTTVLGDEAIFEVSDSGAGISTADQEQLFDPFFRTRAAAAAATQGTGLGLTITKAIVDAHGGSIAIRSAVGIGTTFHVRLPRTRPEQPTDPADLAS
jgi:signal transduction histidine kinase